MDGNHQKKRFRKGAAAVLAALILALPLTQSARAAETPRMLVPVGHTVGVKLFSQGVLVVDLADSPCPARACGLKTGDRIVSCNGDQIRSTEHLQAMLQQSAGEEVTLEACRGSRMLELSTRAVQNETGVWQLGAWIRDSMAGIGTMTYYDPQTGAFGALGHGVTDTDTGQLMSLSSGAIMASTVKAVKRGQAGQAGELRGDFDLTGDLGTLQANADCGVFGTMEPCAITMGEPVEVAGQSEVRTGKATILANVSGDEVAEYEVRIRKVYENGSGNRDMLLEVTDQRLLEQTGGIVQGMSGSPIIQDGKLVGAVTHVLVNDPTKGYGIFIENMLDAAG